MKGFKRNKQGELCYTDSDGRITGKVPGIGAAKEDGFMLSVDFECDDEGEDSNTIIWTE